MRIRPYLELIRPPNLVTAAADPLAGFLVGGGSWHRYDTIVPLMVVSVCLYAAGGVLNDVCDAQRDGESRPERPIPSGRVDTRHAMRFAGLLFAVGLTTAWITAPIVGGVATSLIVAIVFYDTVLKKTILAPGAMGLCRALNLSLGLCAMDPLPSTWVVVLPAALVWLYVSSVTLFARAESGVSKSPVLIAALVGLTTAVVGQAFLHPLFESRHIEQLAFLALLAVVTVRRGYRAIKDPRPAVVQAAVGAFVIGLLFFDASLVWMASGPVAAALPAALIVPAVLLARFFRVS